MALTKYGMGLPPDMEKNKCIYDLESCSTYPFHYQKWPYMVH